MYLLLVCLNILHIKLPLRDLDDIECIIAYAKMPFNWEKDMLNEGRVVG